MGQAGSAFKRFERAVATGNPNLVLAAAHELPKPMQLRDSLRVLLVLATADRERFPSAAARFGSRFVSERRLDVAEAQLAFAALAALVRSDSVAGGEALCALLEDHGERRRPSTWASGCESVGADPDTCRRLRLSSRDAAAQRRGGEEGQPPETAAEVGCSRRSP